MDLTQQNIRQYVLWAALSILLGVLVGLADQLPGDDPIHWRTVAVAGVSAAISVLTTLIRTMTLPKVGTEPVAAQIDHLRKSAVPVEHQEVIAVLPSEAKRAVRHALAAERKIEAPVVAQDHTTPGTRV